MKESERQVGAKGKKHVFAAGRTHPDLRTALPTGAFQPSYVAGIFWESVKMARALR
jgi:hypothetical protein